MPNRQRVDRLPGSSRTVGEASPIDVAIVDGSGSHITSFAGSGGTQYTEGDTDASITGTAILWEDAADTLEPVSEAKPLPVNIVAGSSAGTEYTEGDTDASISGTAILMEGAANTLLPVQGTVADGLLVNLGGNNDVTVAGVATAAKQDDQTTALQLIDDVVYVDDADWTDDTSKHMLIGGVYQSAPHTVTDGDVTPFLSDVNGRMVVAAVQSGTWDEVGINDSGNSITVDGTVAVTGVSTLAEQQTQTTHLATIAGDTTAIETAVQIMDDWDESDRAKVNPIAGQAGVQGGSGTVTALTQRVVLATDVALPAGTNNIGDVDVLSVPRSQSGPGQPGTAVDSYTHAAINLNAGANQVLVSSAANKQIWVYGIGFTVNVAGTVSFQDEDDTAITGIMNFAASSGMAIPPSGNFSMPIWKLATDKDLEVDVVTSELDGWIDYAILSV